MPAADFTPERLQRLIEIDRDHFWFRGRRALISRLLEKHVTGESLDLLDLGSGSGSLSLRLAGMGYCVIAADFLSGGLRRLRSENAGVRVVQTSGETLALRDGCCDAAVALDVLEHLDDSAAVAELHRVLRPGGRLLITVPAFAFLWSFRDTAAGHKRRYDKHMLINLLTSGGFEIERIGYYQFFLFPLAWLSRMAGRKNSTTRDIEDFPHPLLNTVMSLVNLAEVRAGSVIPWPWGSSLYAVARRVDQIECG